MKPKKLVFELTKDFSEIVSTYVEARIIESDRETTAKRIKELLNANRVKNGFDAVALMNSASDQGKDMENILFEFLPWAFMHETLYMVNGNYMELLVVITEPLAD